MLKMEYLNLDSTSASRRATFETSRQHHSVYSVDHLHVRGFKLSPRGDRLTPGGRHAPGYHIGSYRPYALTTD